MSIKGISPSLIEAYNICSMQVYFDRFLEPRPQVPEWIGKIFGDAIHHFIARYIYRQSQYPLGFKDKKSMIGFWCIYWNKIMSGDSSLFKRQIGEIWYRDNENPEEMKKRGIGILDKYWDSNISLPRPPFIEYEISARVNGLNLIGVIDQIRIDPKTDKHVIVDLKTGSTYGDTERDQFTLATNIQLTFYALLYRITFRQEEGGLAIYDLTRGTMLFTQRTNKDIQILLELINKFSDDLSNVRFRRSFGKHCRVCDYQQACYNPEMFFVGERELTDEENHNIIFGFAEYPAIDIQPRQVKIIQTNQGLKQQKPKQLRLKFKR